MFHVYYRALSTSKLIFFPCPPGKCGDLSSFLQILNCEKFILSFLWEKLAKKFVEKFANNTFANGLFV